MPAAKKDALLRILSMMQFIPIFPKWITAKSLHTKLVDNGFDVSKRTIERDLNTFSTLMGLVSGESPEGNKWSYSQQAEFTYLPAVSPEEAVSLKLIQKHLNQHIPPHLFSALTSLFAKSDRVLKGNKAYKTWLDKVAVVPPGIAIKPHNIPADITETLYRGLLENRKVSIRYKTSKRASVVKLLGLIVRDNKLVFACQYEGYVDTRLILAHRVSSAELLDDTYNNHFHLLEYIGQGEMGSALSTGAVTLELDVKGYVLRLLNESSIGSKQQLTEIDKTWSRLTVELPHSKELEHWLQAHIQDLKIIGPEKVKTRVYEALKQGLSHLEMYK